MFKEPKSNLNNKDGERKKERDVERLGKKAERRGKKDERKGKIVIPTQNSNTHQQNN